MTDIYVRSTDGNNADNGSTWALAKATLAGAAAIAAAGDTIYVSHVHAESTSASITHNWPATLGNPVKIICVNDGAEPPTALATTATVTVTSISNITETGSLYMYGIIFTTGNTGSGGSFTCGSAGGLTMMIFDNCSFRIPTGNTLAASGIFIGGTGGTGFPHYIRWLNCSVRFNATGQGITVEPSGRFEWIGGSAVSGTTTPTTLFRLYNAAAIQNVLIEGVDFTNFASTVNLSAEPRGYTKFRNIQVPGSWSGTLLTSSMTSEGNQLEMYNYDGNNYGLWIESYRGTVKHETTLIRSSGASDGTTGLSWKMATTANVAYPEHVLETPEIVIWNESTSSVTATIESLHDSATNLKDNEIWAEFKYFANSGDTLDTMVTDRVAVLATSADQDASSVTWTTSGMTNPNKQKCVATFTPGKKGPIYARVKVAKASKTVYVDPLITLT